MSELFGFLADVQCEAAGEMGVGRNLGVPYGARRWPHVMSFLTLALRMSEFVSYSVSQGSHLLLSRQLGTHLYYSMRTGC